MLGSGRTSNELPTFPLPLPPLATGVLSESRADGELTYVRNERLMATGAAAGLGGEGEMEVEAGAAELEEQEVCGGGGGGGGSGAVCHLLLVEQHCSTAHPCLMHIPTCRHPTHHPLRWPSLSPSSSACSPTSTRCRWTASTTCSRQAVGRGGRVPAFCLSDALGTQIVACAP